MAIDFLVGGVPRGGTTLAAKFMSLHEEIFCYAGETHLIPFMHGMFGELPCREDKVDSVARFLRQQLMTAMVEVPRFNVSRGAHPANVIFEEKDIDNLVESVRSHLNGTLYGVELYRMSLGSLGEILAKADRRPILGEKTPSNIFAMADYAGATTVRNIVVMREPIGVLRSVRARVEEGDPYCDDAFKGDLEANVGMYLEYAMAARDVLRSGRDVQLVRYEDMAEAPARVVEEMLKGFGRAAEERVIRFVEGARDREIADRAPMHYRRLKLATSSTTLSPVDLWKTFSLTRDVREAFGYSDSAMVDLGFDLPLKWPDADVPTRVLPLFGFHRAELLGGSWMKRRASLVAYFGKVQSHALTLAFKSEFPKRVGREVELRISVNGIERHTCSVGTGQQSTVIKLMVNEDELVPMGNKGGYVVVGLLSSAAYTPIGHTRNSFDAREISFLLNSWAINRKKSRRWRIWR